MQRWKWPELGNICLIYLKKEVQRVAKSNGKRTRLCKMWMGKYYIAKFYI